VSSGSINVYKLGTDNQWIFDAKLISSIPQSHQRVGALLSANENTIAAATHWFDVYGQSHARVLMYNKNSENGWQSGPESLQIIVSEEYSYPTSISISNNIMAIGYFETSGRKIAIYEIGNEEVTRVHTITSPYSSTLQDRFGENIYISDDILAVASSGFGYSNPANGAVHIFKKDGTSWGNSPKATIRCVETNTNFASKVWIFEGNVFVAGQYFDSSNGGNAIYIFQEPPSGWSDLAQAAFMKLPNAQPPIPGLSPIATQNYLFFPTPDGKAYSVFKKNSADWSSLVQGNNIVNNRSSQLIFGSSLAIHAGHLIIGPRSFRYPENPPEIVSDFFSFAGSWENITEVNQEITDQTINASGDNFGNDLSGYGRYVVVGASGDTESGLYAGAAYIFEHNGIQWKKKQKIISPQGTNWDSFGHAVAIYDSALFISAVSADSINTLNQTGYSDIGKVYVFRLTGSGWKYQSQLLAPSIEQGGNFGQQIAVSKGYVAITEFGLGDSERTGKVHVYKENEHRQWVYIATLKPKVSMRTDFFGRSIAMNDSVIAVGTGSFETNSEYQMKVYIFVKKTEWKSSGEDAYLLPSSYSRTSLFGHSVAMWGDQIAVGSPGYPAAFINQEKYFEGIVYIFQKPERGWEGIITETAQLLPSDPSRENNFGLSVAMNEKNLFVGAPHSFFNTSTTEHTNNDDNSIKHGRVYHYKAPDNIWTSSNQESRQLHLTQPEWLDGFGSSITLSNQTLFVGSVFDDTEAGIASGSVMAITQEPLIAQQAKPHCTEDGPFTLEGYPYGGSWSGDNIPIQHTDQLILNSPTPGTYTLSYEFGGCATQSSIEIISSGLNLNDSSNLYNKKCINDSVMLYLDSNASEDQYLWNMVGDSTITISSGSKAIFAKDPGIYNVQIHHPVCKTVQRSFTIENEPKPSAEIQPVNIICNDEPIALPAVPTEGQWFGPGVSSGNLFDPSKASNSEIEIYYKYSTPLDCPYYDTLAIHIDKLIKPKLFSSTMQICKNGSAGLRIETTSPDIFVTWYYSVAGEAQEITGLNSLTAKVDKPGDYFALLSKHSCHMFTDTISLVQKRDSIFVPNVFTPNGDDFNPNFQIYATDIENFRFWIFNREGKEQYYTTEPEFKWRPEDLPSGIYYWFMQYSNCINETRKIKGWVQLVK